MNSPRPSTSWRQVKEAQAVAWPDDGHYQGVIDQLRTLPPLVFSGEIRSLKAKLAAAAQGKGFLLQGGDCAEEFSRCKAENVRETLKVLLQMAVVLQYATAKPVIKVGRMAGQYGKPRSKPTEVVGGVEMASYRGDAVNGPAPTLEARTPDPNRLLRAYHCSSATQNLLRAFTKGGYADLHRVHAWNKEFVANSEMGQSYEQLAGEIDAALAFMKACGVDSTQMMEFQQVDFYTSHEALLLGYEDALTRCDSVSGDFYDCSAHLLWIGERTRQLDGAHVEFFRHTKNPIGVKIGPTCTPDELNRLIDTLNPENEWGRLTLITRFGATKIIKVLPRLVRAVTRAGQRVLWSCDPMHGNTYSAETGHKTRHFHHILAELKAFFAVHEAEGTIPGGVHFELTGDDVTECLGGDQRIEDQNLHERYLSSCDPRLNARQALEMAFLIADALNAHQ